MFKQNLLELKEDFAQYHNTDKKALMNKYLDERLSAAIHQYEQDLEMSKKFLARKNEVTILKKMRQNNNDDSEFD